MSEHYFVTADRGHLRIYRERQAPGRSTPGVEAVEAMDFPQGVRSYTERDTDMAGRFGSSRNQATAAGRPTGRAGMSIDERMPMEREESLRRARDLAAELNAFFQQRPESTWDFAAGPDLNGPVLELLAPEIRQRIRKALTKDLVNQPGGEVRAHFAASSDGGDKGFWRGGQSHRE
jgi:hypothetical protein